jgi:hypothetical protein
MARSIPLVRVTQWLTDWDDAVWADDDNLPKPADHFFVGSMPIGLLRRLSGVSRRHVEERKIASGATGYQRAHETERSSRIGRYVRFGFPISGTPGVNPSEHRDLIHPGWLPTAILVNILEPGAERRRHGVQHVLDEDRALSVLNDAGRLSLEIPDKALSSNDPFEPLEIIDGQHRIFAVDGLDDLGDSYEVPVVFFYGLTLSWQAYLFWVINVEPKKINPSLAFDLYPELRSQSWLDRGEGLKVYQEHRAQEVTEAMWRHPASPWRQRIELLGSRVEGHVSNAAFIRTLMATFVRRWGKEDRIGGLFGSIGGDNKAHVLDWNRAQQIAFLIRVWREVEKAAELSTASWATACRTSYDEIDQFSRAKINPDRLDPAFAGPHSLLGTDQGVRAISFVFNALCQVRYDAIGLERWGSDAVAESVTNDSAISSALDSLDNQEEIVRFVRSVASLLMNGGLDWRTSKEPTLTREERLQQAAYRGSSGYKELQQAAIRQLIASDVEDVVDAAKQAKALLRFA